MHDFTAVPHDATVVLAAMSYLLVKHLVADFMLQTETQRHGKGTYGAAGGLAHAATHVALTVPVFAILPTPAPFAVAAILAAEGAIHYHIDWLKEQLLHHHGWTPAGRAFWWALGTDQLAHGLTYLTLIALTFSLALPPAIG